MKDLGKKIRAERKALGLTLKQFADLIGTSSANLQRMETGTTPPRVDKLLEIADICRKPVDEFLSASSNRFQIIESKQHKNLHTSHFDVRILSPFGFISRDIGISHFKGKAGHLIEPKIHRGYDWVYILKGNGIFEYEGIQHKCKKGDVLFYDAEVKHSLKIISSIESVRVTIKK